MNASRAPSISSGAASVISASVSPASVGTNSPSIRLCVAFPPAPWAIVICASRNLARLPRAVSMMPRIRCSRSETGADIRPPLARG